MKVATVSIAGERRVGRISADGSALLPFDLPMSEAQGGILALIRHNEAGLPPTLSPVPLDRLAMEAPMVVLSAGSDGIVGVSNAAGAIADETTVARAKALGIDAASSLEHFDANPLFTALGDALITGPTHNNLRDLRILLDE